jgi:hypothetical protein
MIGFVLIVLSVSGRTGASRPKLVHSCGYEASEQYPWNPVKGIGNSDDGNAKIDRKGGSSKGAGHPKLYEGS